MDWKGQYKRVNVVPFAAGGDKKKRGKLTTPQLSTQEKSPTFSCLLIFSSLMVCFHVMLVRMRTYLYKQS